MGRCAGCARPQNSARMRPLLATGMCHL
jgi:hypothetical protein